MEQVARGRARGTAQTVDDLAGRLIITEALDYDEQTEAVQDAAEFAAEVELIVLDSATGFYRLRRDDEDGGETLRDVARQILTCSRWPASTTLPSCTPIRCSPTRTATARRRSAVTP